MITQKEQILSTLSEQQGELKEIEEEIKVLSNRLKAIQNYQIKIIERLSKNATRNEPQQKQ